MPTLFEDLCAERGLTRNSAFEQIAQAAIEAYLLVSYPGKEDQRPKGGINKEEHGGLHACSAVLNMELFLELRHVYQPGSLKHPLTQAPLSETDILLLKLACIYHDTANTNEITGEEKAHADLFRRDMKSLGFTEAEIEPFAHAVQFKDGEAGKNNLDETKKETKNLFQQEVHDGDCLDIIRIVWEEFNSEHLDLLRDLKDHPEFLEELKQIIKNHADTLAEFKREDLGVVSELRKKGELAPNCYLALVNIHKNLMRREIVYELLQRGIVIAAEDIDLSQFTLRDYYNRKNSPRVKKIIEDLAKPSSAIEMKGESGTEMAESKTSRYLARVLKSSEIDDECAILQNNKKVLEEHKIADAPSLQAYIARQEKGKVFTPPGFIWRPCSYVDNHLPVKLFNDGGVTVIIDPDHSGTFLSHFYKKNANTWEAAKGSFNYERTGVWRLKTRQRLEQHVAKRYEMNQRRKGITDDPGLAYFGEGIFNFDEILGTYQAHGVLAIAVGYSQKNAKDALYLRAKLGRPFRTFCRYSPETGRTPLSEEEVIKQSGISSKVSVLEGMVQTLNDKMKPPQAYSVCVWDDDGDPPGRNSTYIWESRRLQFLDRSQKNAVATPISNESKSDYLSTWQEKLARKLFPDGEPQHIERLSLSQLKTITALSGHSPFPLTIEDNHWVSGKKITCHLQNVDPQSAEKIKYLFQSVHDKYRPSPKNKYQTMVNKIADISLVSHLDKNPPQLSLSIEGKSEGHVDKFIQNHILNELNKLISQETPHLSREDKGLEESLESHFDQLTNIVCLSAGKALAIDNPLKYQFKHPVERGVECIAWMKDGKPTVEFHLPSGEITQSHSHLLPKIAAKHVVERVNAANLHFSDTLTAALIKNLGIENIKFDLAEEGRKKRLLISFDVIDFAQKEDIQKTIIKLLPTRVKESMIRKDTPPQSCVLVVPDVLHVDCIKNAILEAAQKKQKDTLDKSSPHIASPQLSLWSRSEGKGEEKKGEDLTKEFRPK